MPFIAPRTHSPARRLGAYLILACALAGLLNATARGQAACSVATFGEAATFAVRSVRAIVVADFDADGKLDMAAANEFTDDVSIRLGDGAGGFGPAAHFDVGRNPQAIAAGDFNGDGKTDLVTANRSNIQGSLTILPGDGAGGFGNFIQLHLTSPGFSGSASGVAVGNFNGDAFADIVATSAFGISVSLSNGAGGFTTKFFGIGVPAGFLPVVVRDFNEDGLADVAVGNVGSNLVNVLPGDGAGNLGAASGFAAGVTPILLAAGDFNGDANVDIVTNGAVLLGSGGGGFAPALPFTPGGGFPTSIAPADFNADGRADLAVTFRDTRNVLVYQSDGTGALTAASNYTAGGLEPLAVAAGDLNGDGRPDLLVGNQITRTVAVRLNTCGAAAAASALQFNTDFFVNLEEAGTTNVTVIRTGPLQGAASVAYATSDGTAVSPADYTPASGTLDFAEGEPVKTFSVAVNEDNISEGSETVNLTLGSATGAATLGSPTTAELLIFPSDGTPTLSAGDAAAAEGNGGTTDIVFTVTLSNPSASVVTVNYATAGGSATAGADYVSASGTLTFNPGETSRPLTVKINGDTLDENREEFFVNLTGATNATLADAQGVGTIQEDDASCPAPSFAPPTSFAAAAGTWAVAAADFDGDGAPDLAVGNLFSSDITIRLSPAAGGATTSHVAAGVNPRSLAVADFNNDGHADLAATGTSFSTQVSVLLGDGAGGFAAPTSFTSGSGTAIAVAARDFDADGKVDLAVVNLSAGSVAVHPGDGAGGFGPAATFAVGTSPVAVAAADLNGDGHADLVVSNQNSNSVSVLLNQPGGGFAAAVNFAAGANPQHTAVADFDGDGHADLAVTNFNSADVSILLGDGAGGFAAAVSTAVGPRPHAVTTADFNNDGHADLAVTHGGNADETFAAQLSVLFGNGAGAFSAPSDFIPGGSSFGLAAADFNADGKPDLAVSGFSQSAGSVSLLLNSCSSAVSPPRVQFGSPAYNATETGGSVVVTVVRSGDASAPASVEYATSDGTASERGDYTAALGKLDFAAGETTRTFTVFVTDDVFVEDAETVVLTLSGATGAAAGVPSTATLTINSDDTISTTANPIDDSTFFVRQHYRDFLGRDPDADGLAFWVGGIEACGSDQQCRAVKRVDTSAAFFLSIEFQETGFLAYRMYKAAYGDATSPGVPGTVPVIRLREFLADAGRVGQGVVVGTPGWPERLEANKQALAADFVARPRFTAAHPASLTPAEFVDALNANAGGALSPSERDALVAALAGGTMTRAQVLRAVAEDETLRQAETNRAFVLMQYYGYLRRNPDDAPDTNFGGWKFWLDKLDQFNGNFVEAEMVRAFITSIEYRQRFGQ